MNSFKVLLSLTAVVTASFFLIQVATIVNGGGHMGQHSALDEETLLTLNSEGPVEKEDCKEVKSSTSQEENSSTQSFQPPVGEKRSVPSDVTPDGYFNGHPIKHKEFEKGWHSNVHCIGDNFGKDAWKYRSCHFQNFCFDMQNQSFVLFTSPEQMQLEEAMNHADVTNFKPSFGMNTTVSLGGLNQKWTNDGMNKLEWFPQLRTLDEIENTGYYEFLDDAVLLPFHSMAGFNPGHLMWDDFLPIFTILTMFNLVEKDLVLMRFKPVFWQWASCDRRWNSGMRKPYCKTMMTKFLPLLGLTLDTMTTQENANITWTSADAETDKTKFVCAPNGAAGLGMLTDHGSKLHGWVATDYFYSHNFGRGGLLYDFRNWMMNNVNIDPYAPIQKDPYRIVFSVHSSSTHTRNVHFKDHMQKIKDELSSKYPIEIIAKQMSGMSLEEQVELVSTASIFVTMCGGGAVTSMFLPKGASLFAFYNEKEKGGDNVTPARLDWDLVNNLSYLRVHWLPRPQKFRDGDYYRQPGEADFSAFVRLVDHELDIISHGEGR